MIRYAENLKLITRQTDALGDILQLKEATAIQMTYYRNNILHIFAMPSLISCLFINNITIKRKEILRICSLLYPYLKAELFIEWSTLELIRNVSRWLRVMIDEKLINLDSNGSYYHSDTSSAYFIILTVLSRAIIHTLERFYITINILITNGKEATKK